MVRCCSLRQTVRVIILIGALYTTYWLVQSNSERSKETLTNIEQFDTNNILSENTETRRNNAVAVELFSNNTKVGRKEDRKGLPEQSYIVKNDTHGDFSEGTVDLRDDQRRGAIWRVPEAEQLDIEIAALANHFKIYVYDLDEFTDSKGAHPFVLKSTQCGVGTGNNKGYGVERYFIEQIRRSKYRTLDITEANLFLIPVLPCAAKWERKNNKLSKQRNHELGKKFSTNYVSAAVEYVSNMYPYMSGDRPHLTAAQKIHIPMGSDHFWFSTHDGGATRGVRAPHDFVNNSIALVNTADTAMAYKPCWDVSLPCNCDFERPPKPHEHDVLFSDRGRLDQVFFAGNLKSNELRQTIAKSTAGDPFFKMVGQRMNDDDYTHMLRTSTFCLHIRGFQVWSPRLVEYIWFGCIPVILGNDYYLPYSAVFDWDLFSIRICEEDAGNIKTILHTISDDRIRSIRQKLKSVVHHFTFHNPPQRGDAFDIAIYQLKLRSDSLTSYGRDEPIGLCDKMKDDCIAQHN
eukprot:CFRG4253T1